ncbi:MAG: hypothetical protein FWE74_09700, partial [Oscillospiraceae bacterium]|nr:hypothetical protein [Oscillospiraceae bacterium]
MKQKLLITAAIILALTLGACTEPVGDVTEAPPDAVEVPDEVETHDEVELPDEIEPPAQPEPEPEEYPNLKPLELLGYYIDE